jgi:two-component system, chemotaxis family, chemotaxis protein CheY
MDPGGSFMKKTLVVDDSPTIRRMVIASLHDVCTGGFEEAATGLEALEQLALRPMGLIILDLNMPDMHGLEVLRFVRSHQAYAQIPIVVLTTRGDEASRSAVMSAGASIYLTKPFVPQVLAAQVRALMAARLPDVSTAGEGDSHV